MGGHGGLNILPQKRWNVYNYDNREKVRKDEEAAAKEEQLKREQSRKREAEFRLERLRVSRGLPPAAAAEAVESKSNHFNLFDDLKDFPSLGGTKEAKEEDGREGLKKKKLKKEEAAPKVILPEDEKYRLGYGIAGKGVKAPWYLSRPSDDLNAESSRDSTSSVLREREGVKKSGKKTLEELREERLKREKREKDRERALLLEKNNRRDGTVSKVGGFSRR